MGDYSGVEVGEDEVHVWRLAKKVKRHDGPFGAHLVEEEKGEGDSKDGKGGDDEGVAPYGRS
jgi:hypothetical protein